MNQSYALSRRGDQPKAINPPPYYDDGDCNDEDYLEKVALQQEVGRQFGLREVAEEDAQIAIEDNY